MTWWLAMRCVTMGQAAQHALIAAMLHLVGHVTRTHVLRYSKYVVTRSLMVRRCVTLRLIRLDATHVQAQILGMSAQVDHVLRTVVMMWSLATRCVMMVLAAQHVQAALVWLMAGHVTRIHVMRYVATYLWLALSCVTLVWTLMAVTHVQAPTLVSYAVVGHVMRSAKMEWLWVMRCVTMGLAA